MGVYARKTLDEYQRRHGLKVTGVLDAPTRASLIPPAPEPAPSGPLKGVDVSNHQPVVNYAALKAAGFRFAFAKASEGMTYADPYYARHRAGFAAQGITFGAYHFARPGANSYTEGAAEARRFLDLAKPRKGDLFPVLDFEAGNGYLGAYVSGFVDTVKRACGGCIIYGSPYFLQDHAGPSFGACPLWVAHYGVARPMIPRGWSGYAIWQHTSDGHVAGQSGRLDLNVSAGSIDALRIA
jgi:lysozyme